MFQRYDKGEFIIPTSHQIVTNEHLIRHFVSCEDCAHVLKCDFIRSEIVCEYSIQPKLPFLDVFNWAVTDFEQPAYIVEAMMPVGVIFNFFGYESVTGSFVFVANFIKNQDVILVCNRNQISAALLDGNQLAVSYPSVERALRTL